MRHLALLLLALCLPCSAFAARKAVSYPRAHNLRWSDAHTIREWLGVPELAGAPRPFATAIFSENREVPGTYDDIRSKDLARIQRRLASTYGQPIDAEAKLGFVLPFGAFEQSFFLNAAASLSVNDPVFPELSGIIFNDYTFSSAYTFRLPAEISVKPTLVYGLRRTMEQAFTAGSLLESKPNVKLKSRPYRFYSELGLSAEKHLASVGTFGASVTGLPIHQTEYNYWATDLSWRSEEMMRLVSWKFPKKAFLWAGFSPLFGGAYNWSRTIRIGTSLAWFNFLRTDLFLTERFLVGGIISARIAFMELDFFTFERSEDEYKLFRSRQYGLALTGRF